MDGITNQVVNSTNQYESVKTDKTNKSKITGRTIGNVNLSEEAAKYYEELKSKYSNMEFILVSKDMKEQAQAQAGSFANPAKMVVLIDEEKIEKMATDESYRAQYESVIANAASQMSSLSGQLSSGNYSNVVAYGIQLNDDGTTSFFAVLDEQLEASKERLEKQLEKKAEERKTEKQEANRERLENLTSGEGKKIVSASTVEELLIKIQDATFEARSNNVQTEQEKMVGQKFDFSV